MTFMGRGEKSRQVPGKPRWPKHLECSCLFYHFNLKPCLSQIWPVIWGQNRLSAFRGWTNAPDCAECVRDVQNGAIVRRIRCCNLLSHVWGSSSHLTFPFFVFIWKQPSYRASLSSPALMHLCQIRCIWDSFLDHRALRGLFLPLQPPSSTLPPQLFFIPLPSCDSRLVFPISFLAQTLTSNFPGVLVVPE